MSNNRILIDQSNNTVTTDTTSTQNNVILSPDNPDVVRVVENTSNIVTIGVPGPRGLIGPTGSQGAQGEAMVVKTKAQIDTLVSSSLLIPGQLYKITGVDTALYGGTDILIKAATANKLELAGHGIFYNPKYLNSQLTPNNGYGVWSNYMTLTMFGIVGTFTNGDTVIANNGATATYLANGFLQWISGNWSAATSISNGLGATANVIGGVSPSYTIGQDVIWGGKHWTNVTGNVGSSIDKYTLSIDWTVVPFNDADYNVVADIIHYDYDHDMVIRRKDKWDNDVEGNFQAFDEYANPNGYNYGNPIKDFQWGNGNEDWNTDDYSYIGVQSNYIKDSYLECINFIGQGLWHNILTQQSEFRNNITNLTADVSFNQLNNACNIRNNILIQGDITNNVLNSSSGINNNEVYYGSINANIIDLGGIGYNTLSNSNISSNGMIVGGIASNKVTEGSIRNNILNYGLINNNILVNIVGGYPFIEENTISGNSSIVSTTLAASRIANNTLYNNTQFDFSASGTLSNKNIMYIEANYADAVFNISTATIIYGTYSKQLFRNSVGITKLGYYNASNVFTVVNVNV